MKRRLSAVNVCCYCMHHMRKCSRTCTHRGCGPNSVGVFWNGIRSCCPHSSCWLLARHLSASFLYCGSFEFRLLAMQQRSMFARFGFRGQRICTRRYGWRVWWDHSCDIPKQCGPRHTEVSEYGVPGTIYLNPESNFTHILDVLARDAAAKRYPAWIVFDVSGTIHLRSFLNIESDKTIDGRGKRVVITGHGIRVK